MKALRRAGFEVEAANGSAAINLIRANRSIDAILLDATLPGPPILKFYGKLPGNVKVALSSAYSPEMIADGGLVKAPPVRHFLRKPFDLADLAHKLRSIVSS